MVSFQSLSSLQHAGSSEGFLGSWSKMTPSFLTALLVVKVMPSRVSMWFVTKFFKRFLRLRTITSVYVTLEVGKVLQALRRGSQTHGPGTTLTHIAPTCGPYIDTKKYNAVWHLMICLLLLQKQKLSLIDILLLN